MLDCQLDQNGNKPERRERVKMMSCSEHWEIARVKQQKKTRPDPFLVRKFAVFLVVGLFGWTYYVFVVRLAIPMVRRESSAIGSIGEGGALSPPFWLSHTQADPQLPVALLVIYHLLFVMFVWSYSMAIFNGPGYAKDVRFLWLVRFSCSGPHSALSSLCPRPILHQTSQTWSRSMGTASSQSSTRPWRPKRKNQSSRASSVQS